MSLYLEKDEDIVASFGEFLLSLKLSLLSKKDGSDLKIRKVKSCPQMAQTCCSNAVTSRTGAIELCTKNMCSKQKQVAFRHDFKIFIWLLTYNFLSLSMWKIILYTEYRVYTFIHFPINMFSTWWVHLMLTHTGGGEPYQINLTMRRLWK